MAMTVSHPSARKVWANILEKSIYQASFFLDSPLVKRVNAGDSIPPDCVIAMQDELMNGKGPTKGAGYIINYDLDGPLFGIPTSGDNVIQGYNRLSLFSDQIQINQDRFPVQNEGKFADGLVPYGFLERVRERATNDFWRHYYDERFVAKISGSLGVNTWVTIDPTKATSSARNVNGSVASDGNDLRAYAASRILYGNSKGSAAAMTTSDGLSLDIIDQAIMQAIRPASNSTLKRLVPTLTIAGRPAFVLLADYVTLQSMNANTSQRFYDLQRAGVQGGGSKKDICDWARYLYQSPMGVDVYIVPHPNLVKFNTYGGASLKAVRCILLGKGAVRLAMGRDSKDVGSFSWHEREADEGNQIIVTTGVVTGIQRTAYNTTETGTVREDYAALAVDVYANWAA